jgi:hypothetical protein
MLTLQRRGDLVTHHYYITSITNTMSIDCFVIRVELSINRTLFHQRYRNQQPVTSSKACFLKDFSKTGLFRFILPDTG